MPDKIKPFDIEQWIKTIPTGEFHYKEILSGQIDPSSYDRLRKILYDLSHSREPVVESVGRRDGYYRPIQNHALPVQWQTVEAKTEFPLVLPFDLREYVFIYPNTVSVIAGSKSSGKTGFLYRTVAMNMKKVNTILLTNMEGGKEQLRDRFYAMDIDIPVPAPFTVYPVTENYHDYIKQPNSLYVIDYIDVPADEKGPAYYMIGSLITKIRNKLDNSVAVVGLQKPSGRDVAFGGENTLKDATLYIALNSGKLKIVDAKVPANPRIHPKNMQWTFIYSDEGTSFLNITPCHEE